MFQKYLLGRIIFGILIIDINKILEWITRFQYVECDISRQTDEDSKKTVKTDFEQFEKLLEEGELKWNSITLLPLQLFYTDP